MGERVSVCSSIVLWSPGHLPAAGRTTKLNNNYYFEGAVRRLEQRRPWKYGGVEHLPNHESFDVEFSPTGLVLELTDYRKSGAVYRINRYAYDEAGRLVRSVEFDGNGREVAISKYENLESKQLSVTRDSSGIVV